MKGSFIVLIMILCIGSLSLIGEEEILKVYGLEKEYCLGVKEICFEVENLEEKALFIAIRVERFNEKESDWFGFCGDIFREKGSKLSIKVRVLERLIGRERKKYCWKPLETECNPELKDLIKRGLIKPGEVDDSDLEIGRYRLIARIYIEQEVEMAKYREKIIGDFEIIKCSFISK